MFDVGFTELLLLSLVGVGGLLLGWLLSGLGIGIVGGLSAVRDAVIETDLDPHLFPAACPYTLAEILNEDWLPDA